MSRAFMGGSDTVVLDLAPREQVDPDLWQQRFDERMAAYEQRSFQKPE